MTNQELVKKLQLEKTPQGEAILRLTQENINLIESIFSPEDDALIHVCDEYFSVNFGNIGSQGIKYYFN